MHCYEGILMRDYLFGLVRELDPTAGRDDLALEDLLERHAIDSLAALLELGSDRMLELVRELSDELPLAA